MEEGNWGHWFWHRGSNAWRKKQWMRCLIFPCKYLFWSCPRFDCWISLLFYFIYILNLYATLVTTFSLTCHIHQERWTSRTPGVPTQRVKTPIYHELPWSWSSFLSLLFLGSVHCAYPRVEVWGVYLATNLNLPLPFVPGPSKPLHGYWLPPKTEILNFCMLSWSASFAIQACCHDFFPFWFARAGSRRGLLSSEIPI